MMKAFNDKTLEGASPSEIEKILSAAKAKLNVLLTRLPLGHKIGKNPPRSDTPGSYQQSIIRVLMLYAMANKKIKWSEKEQNVLVETVRVDEEIFYAVKTLNLDHVNFVLDKVKPDYVMPWTKLQSKRKGKGKSESDSSEEVLHTPKFMIFPCVPFDAPEKSFGFFRCQEKEYPLFWYVDSHSVAVGDNSFVRQLEVTISEEGSVRTHTLPPPRGHTMHAFASWIMFRVDREGLADNAIRYPVLDYKEFAYEDGYPCAIKPKRLMVTSNLSRFKVASEKIKDDVIIEKFSPHIKAVEPEFVYEPDVWFESLLERSVDVSIDMYEHNAEKKMENLKRIYESSTFSNLWGRMSIKTSVVELGASVLGAIVNAGKTIFEYLSEKLTELFNWLFSKQQPWNYFLTVLRIKNFLRSSIIKWMTKRPESKVLQKLLDLTGYMSFGKSTLHVLTIMFVILEETLDFMFPSLILTSHLVEIFFQMFLTFYEHYQFHTLGNSIRYALDVLFPSFCRLAFAGAQYKVLHDKAFWLRLFSPLSLVLTMAKFSFHLWVDIMEFSMIPSSDTIAFVEENTLGTELALKAGIGKLEEEIEVTNHELRRADVSGKEHVKNKLSKQQRALEEAKQFEHLSEVLKEVEVSLDNTAMFNELAYVPMNIFDFKLFGHPDNSPSSVATALATRYWAQTFDTNKNQKVWFERRNNEHSAAFGELRTEYQIPLFAEFESMDVFLNNITRNMNLDRLGELMEQHSWRDEHAKQDATQRQRMDKAAILFEGLVPYYSNSYEIIEQHETENTIQAKCDENLALKPIDSIAVTTLDNYVRVYDKDGLQIHHLLKTRLLVFPRPEFTIPVLETFSCVEKVIKEQQSRDDFFYEEKIPVNPDSPLFSTNYVNVRYYYGFVKDITEIQITGAPNSVHIMCGGDDTLLIIMNKFGVPIMIEVDESRYDTTMGPSVHRQMEDWYKYIFDRTGRPEYVKLLENCIKSGSKYRIKVDGETETISVSLMECQRSGVRTTSLTNTIVNWYTMRCLVVFLAGLSNFKRKKRVERVTRFLSSMGWIAKVKIYDESEQDDLIEQTGRTAGCATFLKHGVVFNFDKHRLEWLPLPEVIVKHVSFKAKSYIKLARGGGTIPQSVLVSYQIPREFTNPVGTYLLYYGFAMNWSSQVPIMRALVHRYQLVAEKVAAYIDNFVVTEDMKEEAVKLIGGKRLQHVGGFKSTLNYDTNDFESYDIWMRVLDLYQMSTEDVVEIEDRIMKFLPLEEEHVGALLKRYL